MSKKKNEQKPPTILTDFLNGAGQVKITRRIKNMMFKENEDFVTLRALIFSEIIDGIKAGTPYEGELKPQLKETIGEIRRFIKSNDFRTLDTRDAFEGLLSKTCELALLATSKKNISVEDAEDLAQTLSSAAKDMKHSDPFREIILSFVQAVVSKAEWARHPAAGAADPQSHPSLEPESLLPPGHQ
ncbi:MAG: hypothetical protein KA155_03465 [Alphaproteobacteria bacterium]|jgi:hypothetical protein|nr:hypothetical protein [Alphaproteobacteria bacterium]